jgi:hypothetical protein
VNLSTQTTTYVQGKCWMLIPTTLSGLLTGVLGAVIAPFSASFTTGISVGVAARDTTQ